jgi:ribosomal protein S18 acetylase RimI-like enzyme
MVADNLILKGKLRSLDSSRDLGVIADLIELCFMGTMDEDGRDYIGYLRKMAQESKNMTWGFGALQNSFSPMQGFVYELNGSIIGNLSMLPFQKGDEFVYLIANVAVHPAYRRHGIARDLTARAIQHARSKNAVSTWLQVRDDNPAAQQLYLAMGFSECCRRSTWTLRPDSRKTKECINRFNSSRRSFQDWKMQKEWLSNLYPENVRWNIGLKENKLEPGILKSIRRFLNGHWVRHWSLKKNDRLVGVASLERTHLYADNLWLATEPGMESSVLEEVIPQIQKDLFFLRPMTVNFPDKVAEESFQLMGFDKNHTLIWMEERLMRPVSIEV